MLLTSRCSMAAELVAGGKVHANKWSVQLLEEKNAEMLLCNSMDSTYQRAGQTGKECANCILPSASAYINLWLGSMMYAMQFTCCTLLVQVTYSLQNSATC